jgi:hypothetical protein
MVISQFGDTLKSLWHFSRICSKKDAGRVVGVPPPRKMVEMVWVSGPA